MPDLDPERSDVDFLVEHPPGYNFGPWLIGYFTLEKALVSLFSRKVDLLMTSGMCKKYDIQAANETSQPLYAA